MSKQKKTEAAILEMLDKFSLDTIDVSERETSDTSQKSNTLISSSKQQPCNIDKTNELGQIIQIETSKCRPWKYADRNENEMGDIEELSNSIKSNGQQEPILVRPAPNNQDGIEYEVIFGHRRWLACKLCSKKVIAIKKNLSDKDAAVAQKEENDNRENLSPFAKSQSYKKLLDNGIFKSQTELSAHMGLSRQTIAALMSFNKIHSKIMHTIKQPHNIPLRTAIKLAQLSESIKTEEELNRLISVIPQIESGVIPFKKIDAKLLSPLEQEKNTKKENIKITSRVIKNDFNVKLFTAGLNHNKVPSITFHKMVTDNNLYEEVVTLVENFLKEKTRK